jgi:TolB-like protein/tetratricopeptide (TPR) repeat protein/predicted Ser/Thr protein kinase
MIGKQISHYEILDKLGEGGMGEVFLARDTRLGRNVALKFVPDDIQGDKKARERLLREATAASKLSHANIVSLYDIGEADGRDFIVMEYVDGCSLGDMIASDDLTLTQAVDLASQICRALAAAHSNDVIHRDIKPDNILVTTDGVVKVLDFGLAKIEGASQLTEDGSTVGTVAYMSPEQLRGEEVDQRSDLFSLGVLLYEMVTGRKPFQGEHRAAISYSILNEDAEPLARFKAGVPDELQRIVAKLLRKDKETRYQIAGGVLADIEASKKMKASRGETRMTRWRKRIISSLIGAFVIAVAVVGYLATRSGEQTAVKGEEDVVKIAVLPFDNLGPAEDEYFADGITEEITARLASIHGLGVIARTSILQYEDTKKPIQQIADELDVDYILEGTVRWQHSDDGTSRVRVTPQLIRVTDATHTWAHVYDEPMIEVFEVQTDIAMSVTEELDITLLDPDRQSVEAIPTESVEAYDFYLRGIDYKFKGQNTEHLRIAEDMFKKAIELDPGFSQAYAMLSAVHSNLYWLGVDRTQDRLAMSEEAVRKAAELDPNAFTTRMSLGYHYYHGELDYDRALEQFEKAKESQPGSMDAYAAIGYVKRRQGEWDESLRHMLQALELDPRSPELVYEIGETMGDLGRYEEAERYLDQAINLAPDLALPFFVKFWVYIAMGDLESARAVVETAPHDPSYQALAEFWLLFLERRFDRTLDELRSAQFPAFSVHFYYTPIAELMAFTYLAMGEPDSARAWFDSSRVQLEALVASEPNDPRYYSALGVAYAGLGRKDDAIREGKRGADMMPVSKESKQGPPRREDLARIYMLIGEYEAAIDELEYLLSIPASMKVPMLRINPMWDRLRDHPRFQKLLE